MKLPIFKLEEYLGHWEFKAPFLFCNSDLETLSMKELLDLADPVGRALWENLHLGYTEVGGLPQLLKEISGLYQQIQPPQILTFAGAEEGIYAAFQALLSPEDHVIIVTPCYQSLQAIPQSIGCQVSSVSLDPKLNWRLDLNRIKDSFRPHTKMIVINFPHNPTGATLKQEELMSLIELARERGVYLFSDEVYRFLELEVENRRPAMADLYEKGISLGVMSKAWGLAGLRIGWIATQDDKLTKQMGLVKHYLSICNSAPSEVLAIIALRAKEKILHRNHEIMRQNLALLDLFFERYAETVQWIRPTGGCVGFPELKIKKPIESVAERLVKEEGVLIMPGSLYDWPGNYFRLGFGRRNMPEALQKFEKFLQKAVG